MECSPVQSEMSCTVKDILQNIEQASRMTAIASEVLGGVLRWYCAEGRAGGDCGNGEVRKSGTAGLRSPSDLS